MALSNPALTNYRGRYEALLKDMKRINNEMFDKENDAMLNRDKSEQEVESSVVQDA